MSDIQGNRRIASAFVDKSLFLAVAVVGAVAMALLKLRGFDQILVTVVPVVLLLIYVALVSLETRFRLRLDQAGDNAYYLGFIFTLISLGLALYQFVGDAQQVTETIIRNFGIALATTIVGITLRVVLHQMREDPIDTERAARAELAAASQNLRAQVNQVMVEINRMRVEFQQRQGEYEHELAERREQQDQDRLKRAGAFDANAQAMAAALDRMVASIDAQAGRIEQTSVPEDIFARRFAALFTNLDQFAHKINAAMAGNVAMLQQSSQAAAEAAASWRGLMALEPALRQGVAAVSDLQASVAAIRSDVETIEVHLAELARTLPEGGRES